MGDQMMNFERAFELTLAAIEPLSCESVRARRAAGVGHRRVAGRGEGMRNPSAEEIVRAVVHRGEFCLHTAGWHNRSAKGGARRSEAPSTVR